MYYCHPKILLLKVKTRTIGKNYKAGIAQRWFLAVGWSSFISIITKALIKSAFGSNSGSQVQKPTYITLGLFTKNYQKTGINMVKYLLSLLLNYKFKI